MKYMTTDNHPLMGLNNKICKNPEYWCRLHKVWLSEDDVKRKRCKCKPTYDMLGTQICGCLERKDLGNGINR